MIKKTEAIILRQRNFGNTSLIFTLYTKDFGKIDALAKGIKKTISRGEGGIETLSRIELIYYEREPKTLRLISQLYLLNSLKSIRASPLKFVYASYLIELADNLVHGEEKNEKIYNLLLNCLSIMENEQDIPRLVHFFELKLIKLLGYSLLSSNISSQALPPSSLSIIQFLENADFKTLPRLKLSKKDEKELATIIQNYIGIFSGTRQLRSPSVIKKLICIGDCPKIYGA